MTNAHRRKKQPELVRQSLLQHAAALAVEKGLHAVTIQAVANLAGVTKGGVMHHFATKRALLEAVFLDIRDSYNALLHELMAEDPEPYGAFTRAHVRTVMDAERDQDDNTKSSLAILTLGDAGLRALWNEWYTGKLAEYRDTDGSDALEIVRFAADGIWLASISGREMPNRQALRERLLRATYPPEHPRRVE